MVKRLLDVTAAAAGLLLLGPLMCVVAVLIKVDSPGPVLYRQERVGRGGETFRIRKFRTMESLNNDAGMLITVGGDPRITRVGSWLRRWKIDELPQLIDVLRGDMSIVGPRPEVPKYVALYPKGIRERVLSVRPGITDFASVAYRDENEILRSAPDPEAYYRDVLIPAKLDLALKYVHQQSLVTDLRIIALTIATLLRLGSQDPTRGGFFRTTGRRLGK